MIERLRERAEYLPVQLEALVSGTTITVESERVPLGYVWEVERAVVSTNSVGLTTARVYINSVDQRNLRSGTDAGNFDEAEYSPPIRLASGERIVIVWSNADALSRGFAELQVKQIATSPDRLGADEGSRRPSPVHSIAGS